MASCRHADAAAALLGSSAFGMQSLPLLLQRATSGRHQIGSSSSYFMLTPSDGLLCGFHPSSSPPREPHLECRSHPHMLGTKGGPGSSFNGRRGRGVARD